MRVIDVTGQSFGRLTVLERAPSTPGDAMWLCLCSCGRTRTVRSKDLRNGHTRSCGCLNYANARTHGRCGTREYNAWRQAKARCYNPKSPAYAYYGGRGIAMCDEWLASFEAFFRDVGPCPPGYSLDRIDTNGNYEPGNCRWATLVQQANNRRNGRWLEFRGERHTISEWARILGIPRARINMRLERGSPVEKALR